MSLCLNIAGWVTNSVDPNQMPQNVWPGLSLFAQACFIVIILFRHENIHSGTHLNCLHEHVFSCWNTWKKSTFWVGTNSIFLQLWIPSLSGIMLCGHQENASCHRTYLQVRRCIHIIFFLFFLENYIVGTHLKCISEAFLMNTLNICFCTGIRKTTSFFGWKICLIQCCCMWLFNYFARLLWHEIYWSYICLIVLSFLFIIIYCCVQLLTMYFMVLISKDCLPDCTQLQIRGGMHVIFSFFLHESICCGYSLEVPHWGTSNEYHNICFHGEIRKISLLFDRKKLCFVELRGLGLIVSEPHWECFLLPLVVSSS